MIDKIIFLDIDGVLNSYYFYQSKSHQRNVKKNGYDMVNQICKRNLFWLSLLCRLTKSKVVLSSTWKYGWNEDGSVRKDIKVSDAIDNNWIVESGLKKDDIIVVSGIQSINNEGQNLKIIDNEEYIKNLNAGK